MGIKNIVNYFIDRKKNIDNESKKTWVMKLMEKHNLSLLDLKSIVLENQEMSKKTSKVYYMLFQSHSITILAYVLFLCVSFAFYPRLGGWGIIMSFVFCLYYIYANDRIKKNRIRKYILDNM
jgi:hypothetical protein